MTFMSFGSAITIWLCCMLRLLTLVVEKLFLEV
jgi:hypothetical protein